MNITNREKDVLHAIELFTFKHRYAPSVRDIADALGWSSSSTAHGYLQRLKKKGYISWEPDRPRTLKVIK